MVNVQVKERVMVRLAHAHAIMDLMEITVKVSVSWKKSDSKISLIRQNEFIILLSINRYQLPW